MLTTNLQRVELFHASKSPFVLATRAERLPYRLEQLAEQGYFQPRSRVISTDCEKVLPEVPEVRNTTIGRLTTDKRAKAIVCITEKLMFASCLIAARYYHMHYNNLKHHLTGTAKFAKGMEFRYATDEERETGILNLI